MIKAKALRMAAALATLATLAACAPEASRTEAPAAAADAAPVSVPSDVMKQTFADCSWTSVTGAGVAIDSFACPNRKLVADEALPGLQLQVAGPDGKTEQYPAIRIFAKAADAPIDAVLPAVRAASPGPHTGTCVLMPAAGDPTGRAFQFVPTGAGKAALEAFEAGGAESDGSPCGPLGPTPVGDRVFRLLADAPDKVVFVELGSEIQMFDPSTLRAAK